MAKILIVDDQPANRQLLAAVLQHQSHQLLEAGDGAEALDCVRRDRPHLVLSDILMPTMDGYEFVRRLRTDPAIAATPVIFTSAHYLEREARALAERCAIHHILPKPLDPQAVLDVVAAVLAGASSTPAATESAPLEDFDPEHVRVLTDKLSQTHDRLQSANLRLTAVIELCGELAVEREPMRLLECLTRSARDVVGARCAAVLVLDDRKPDSAATTRVITCGADDAKAEWLDQAIRGTHSLRALSLSRPAMRLSGLTPPEPGGEPAPVVAVAINSLTRHYGWLCLVGKVGLADFTQDDERLAIILAAQTGRIYENGRLYRDLVHRTDELESEVSVSNALVQAGHDLISGLGTPNLAAKLCELNATLLGCEYSYSLVLNESQQTYTFVAAHGPSEESWEVLREVRIPRRSLVHLERRLEASPVFEIATDEAEPNWASALEGYGIRRILCAPLKRGNKNTGIQIAACRRQRGAFSSVQRRIAHGIAHLGSLALENARLMLELAEANRLKSEFVATMSHELRTPLNIIIGYNSLVRDGEFGSVNEEQQDVLGRVESSAHELLALINNLLDLGRLEVGRVRLEQSAVDVAALLDEIRSELSAQQPPNALAVDWETSEPMPVVTTDTVKLRVVIKNLLSNALKFTREGSIQVRAFEQDSGVEIVVCDTGPGIPTEELPHIFEPFRQLAPAATREHGGVGLGLYITRRLLDLLGGTVDVESEVGSGSCFRVWIPPHPSAPRELST